MSQVDVSIEAGSKGSAVLRLLSRPLTPQYRLATAGAWLAAVWATTHWYSWQRTVDLLFGSDMPEYELVEVSRVLAAEFRYRVSPRGLRK